MKRCDKMDEMGNCVGCKDGMEEIKGRCVPKKCLKYDFDNLLCRQCQFGYEVRDDICVPLYCKGD